MTCLRVPNCCHTVDNVSVLGEETARVFQQLMKVAVGTKVLLDILEPLFVVVLWPSCWNLCSMGRIIGRRKKVYSR